jgi:hypothetical protein
MRFQDYENLYPLLENLKDYFITSSKYQGQTMVCGYGHVVVLSNFPPYPYDSSGKHLIGLDRITVIEAQTSPEELDPNPPPPKGTIKDLTSLIGKVDDPTLANQNKTDSLIKVTKGSDIKPREKENNVLDDIEKAVKKGKLGKIKGKG